MRGGGIRSAGCPPSGCEAGLWAGLLVTAIAGLSSAVCLPSVLIPPVSSSFPRPVPGLKASTVSFPFKK